MCGIVAIISKKTHGFIFKDTDLFKQMLYADALRGFDSTGIFGVNKYHNLKMHKSAKPAAEFLATKSFEDFKSDMFNQYRVVVGHNRAATKGSTIDENAHPFIEDHICLVHNGTLHEHKSLAEKEVDSHAICHAIAKEGYKEVIPKLNGAYALIWYDALEKKLFITRNDQRPLWLIETPDADYIASEPTMLIWLVQRNHNKVYKPVFFDPEKIYSYDVTKLEDGFDVEQKPKKAMPVVVTKPSKLVQVHKKSKGWKQKSPKILELITNPSTTDNTLPKIGDTLFFTYTRSLVQDNVIKVEGKWVKDKSVEVSGYINVKSFSADQIEYMLEYATEFYGTYKGFSIKQNKSVALFVENVQSSNEYETLTGEFVTDRHLYDAGNCCHECGEILQPDLQETEFWVRLKGDHIKDMKCPTCVAQHPHLSVLLEKKCISESSSSATSSVQSLSVH